MKNSLPRPSWVQASAQRNEPTLKSLMAALWKVNGTRRALAEMSQAWVARLQQSSLGATSASSMSRANSVEEARTSGVSNSIAHSTHTSVDQSLMDSVEEKASGLKDLARNIAAGHFVVPSFSPKADRESQRASQEQPRPAPDIGEPVTAAASDEDEDENDEADVGSSESSRDPSAEAVRTSETDKEPALTDSRDRLRDSGDETDDTPKAVSESGIVRAARGGSRKQQLFSANREVHSLTTKQQQTCRS